MTQNILFYKWTVMSPRSRSFIPEPCSKASRISLFFWSQSFSTQRKPVLDSKFRRDIEESIARLKERYSSASLNNESKHDLERQKQRSRTNQQVKEKNGQEKERSGSCFFQVLDWRKIPVKDKTELNSDKPSIIETNAVDYSADNEFRKQTRKIKQENSSQKICSVDNFEPKKSTTNWKEKHLENIHNGLKTLWSIQNGELRPGQRVLLHEIAQEPKDSHGWFVYRFNLKKHLLSSRESTGYNDYRGCWNWPKIRSCNCTVRNSQEKIKSS